MMNYNNNCDCISGFETNNSCNMIQDKCSCNCNFEFELKNECDLKEKMTREEMDKKLKCYRFAIIELGLYLDTHPDDEKAICLHKEYSNRFKELSDKYQRIYGPLTIMFPCNKWRWLEEPWLSAILEEKAL